MQFKGVNSKEHRRSLVVSGFFAHAHASKFHVLFVLGVLACALSVNLQRCVEWQLIVMAVFPTPSLPLSIVYSV